MDLPDRCIGLIEPRRISEASAHQFYRLQAAMGGWDVTLAITALDLRAFEVSAAEEASGNLVAASRILQRRSPAILGLSGGPVIGLKGLSFWLDRLRPVEADLGIPCVTDVECVFTALRTLGARRIVMANKWPALINASLRDDLARWAGVEVVGSGTLPHTAAEVDMPPRTGVELCGTLCRAALEGLSGRPDAIFLGGGAWYGMLAVPPLEEELGIPIVTNIGAFLWYALHAVDRLRPVTGWGRLFGTAPAVSVAALRSEGSRAV